MRYNSLYRNSENNNFKILKGDKIMKRIGAHVSASGGVFNAPLNAMEIGAKAFAMFTKNQRQWAAKPLTNEEIKMFKDNMEKGGYLPENVLAHDSYLINIGHPNLENRQKSIDATIEELQRCDALGIAYLNIHPGTSLKEISDEECLDNIANSINIAFTKTKNTILVLENTAGQGSNVGYKFEHIRHIIDKVEDKSRIGACIDTCHSFAAGYNLKTKEGYEQFIAEFDKIVGLNYLKGMHINDSKSKFASRVDRHESLGKGEIGLEMFECLMNDNRIDEIPMILETIVPEIWADEIKMLYGFIKK